MPINTGNQLLETIDWLCESLVRGRRQDIEGLILQVDTQSRRLNEPRLLQTGYQSWKQAHLEIRRQERRASQIQNTYPQLINASLLQSEPVNGWPLSDTEMKVLKKLLPNMLQAQNIQGIVPVEKNDYWYIKFKVPNHPRKYADFGFLNREGGSLYFEFPKTCVPAGNIVPCASAGYRVDDIKTFYRYLRLPAGFSRLEQSEQERVLSMIIETSVEDMKMFLREN